MNRLSFPGVRKPLSNFDAVKTDLQTQLLVYELDLSTARSLAANTAEELRFAGNALYVDKASDVGNGTIIFQDDSRLKPARVYVQPGFIARVPWTRLLIENTAQAGKVLRIFYGVDIDFVPGTSSDVNIAGTVTSNISPADYGLPTAYGSISALASNSPETVFSAAANVNGAIVWDAQFETGDTVTLPRASFIYRTSAPVNVVDGRILVQGNAGAVVSGFYSIFGRLRTPTRIPAGYGLYFISETAETRPHRSALYTLL